MTTHDRLIHFLDQQHVQYDVITNQNIKGNSCEDAAAARGLELKYGAKSLLVKANNQFYLFTLSAALKAQSRLMRKLVQCQKLRFATEQELWEYTQVEKGALPPFGFPFLPCEQFLDESIFNLDRIAFNAGVLNISIVMDCSDFISLVQAKRAQFSG